MKGVELQIAVPRTTEATNVQHQLNHKPGYDQAALANQSSKKSERQRKQAVRADGAGFLNVREDGSQGTRSDRLPRRKKDGAVPLGAKEQGHPFKGNHIDITL